MAVSTVLTCAQCGKPMRGSKSLPQGQATCHPCRRIKRVALAVPRARPDHRLAGCGHRVPYHSGQQRKKCDDCLHPVRACMVCGADITARRVDVKFCSEWCWEVSAGRRLPEPLTEIVCALPGCGVRFVPLQRKQRCCSEGHGKALYNRLSRADGRQLAQPWDDRRRDHYQRRRALKKGASTGRPVSMTEIAERDGWVCGICHLPVGADVPWPDPLSKSLDHILALTRGGLHDPDNIQLAHLGCNSSKGNRAAA